MWMRSRVVARRATIAPLALVVASITGCGATPTGQPVDSAAPKVCAASAADPAPLRPHGSSHLRLVAAPTTFTVGGRTVRGETYNGELAGPIIHVQPGEHLTLTLVNHLAIPTNLHFHGMHVSPSGASDNPFVSVAPGKEFTYHVDVPANHPQGTFWYHDHGMVMPGPSAATTTSMPGMAMAGTGSAPASKEWGTNTESQISAGLAGTIVVGDNRTLLPARLRNIVTHTLVFKDIQTDKAGHVVQDAGGASIDSNAPTQRLVNGQVQPTLTMCPGQTQLWRLANEGADIFYRLHAAGYRFSVIAQDGQPAANITQADTLLLPPGKRYDVLVTAGAHPGTSWLSTLPYSNGPQGDNYPAADLMAIRVTGTPQKPVTPPSGAMPTVPKDLTQVAPTTFRTVVLGEDSSGTSFKINDKPFDMNRSIFTTPGTLGTTEQWTVVNSTGETHPFHVHTNDFQVLSINGAAQPFTGWQDTVPVPHATNGKPGTVVIRLQLADFTGKVMFHCHIAAHEDNGMMSYLEVQPRH